MSQSTVTRKNYPTPLASKRSIVKSNQINEGVFKLTAIEYRLILLLISQIQENNIEGGLKYHFNTKYIYQLFNMTKNKDAYARIRDSVMSLHTKTVKIQCGNVEIQHNWLISSYYSNENGNFILELNPNLTPYLSNLTGHFTKYRLNNVLALPTIRSIRLYELLKQYVRAGRRTFTCVDIRLQLGLDAKEYPKSYDFKTRILKPAIKVINSKTDIQVELIELKDGRAIRGYQFMVKEQKVVSPPELKETRLLSAGLTAQLQQIGFTPRQVQYLSERHTEKFLQKHLDATMERHNVTPYADLYSYLQQRFREKHTEDTKNFPKAKNATIADEINTSIKETKEKEALQALAVAETNNGSIEAQLTVGDLPATEQYMLDALNSEVNDSKPIQRILPNYQSEEAPTPYAPIDIHSNMATSYAAQELTPSIQVGGRKAKKSYSLSAKTYKALTDMGLNTSQIKHLTFNYDEQRIVDNLAYTLERHLKKPLDLPVRYFLSAVEKNYHKMQQDDLEGARGLLKGDIVSHLPDVPNPVEPDLAMPMSFELPNVTTYKSDNELINDELDVSMEGIDRETLNYLLQYRIEVGFMQSTDDLKALMFEYIPKIERSVSNGVSLEVISSHENKLVEFYLSNKH